MSGGVEADEVAEVEEVDYGPVLEVDRAVRTRLHALARVESPYVAPESVTGEQVAA